MQPQVEERLAQLEQSVRRFRCVVIVLALLVPTVAAMMQKDGPIPAFPVKPQQSAKQPMTERQGVPTGRTLEDVRKEFDPPRDHLPRASATPEPPRRQLKIVDAEILVLLDRNGNVRAEIGVDSQEKSRFKMYDATGRPRLELAESSGTATIKLLDQTGTPLIQLQQSDKSAEILLASESNSQQQNLKMVSSFGKTGVYLSGTRSERAVSLELEQHGEPQLSIAAGGTYAQYHSRGLHVGSNSGNLAFYLTPDKRAALSMSACRPVSGQESIELSATPGSAQLSLNSLEQGANALVHVSKELTSLSLKPTNKEAVLVLSIRDRQELADSRILMQSNDGQESIHINLDQAGPRLDFFDKSGNSVTGGIPRP